MSPFTIEKSCRSFARALSISGSPAPLKLPFSKGVRPGRGFCQLTRVRTATATKRPLFRPMKSANG